MRAQADVALSVREKSDILSDLKVIREKISESITVTELLCLLADEKQQPPPVADTLELILMRLKSSRIVISCLCDDFSE